MIILVHTCDRCSCNFESFSDEPLLQKCPVCNRKLKPAKIRTATQKDIDDREAKIKFMIERTTNL